MSAVNGTHAAKRGSVSEQVRGEGGEEAHRVTTVSSSTSSSVGWPHGLTASRRQGVIIDLCRHGAGPALCPAFARTGLRADGGI